MEKIQDHLLSDNIQISQIENIEEFKEIIMHIKCPVCLEIPINLIECSICESIICEECHEILIIADKTCLTNKCKGDFKKANKFIREILSKIKVSCLYCGKNNLEYSNYLKHLYETCEVYKLVDYKKAKYLKEIKEVQNKVENLQEKLNVMKLNKTMEIINRTPNKNNEKINKEGIRNKFLSFDLATEKKMELYNSAIKGDFNVFKNLIINKNYPLFEEISASTHYWTAFHYAMHYGQVSIIFFIFEYLNQKGHLESAIHLQSADGRCPLLCLLRSNCLEADKKKSILSKLFQKYKFHLSSNVRKEINARHMEDLITNY